MIQLILATAVIAILTLVAFGIYLTVKFWNKDQKIEQGIY
jgi:flagellar biogenesis protein FliO